MKKKNPYIRIFIFLVLLLITLVINSFIYNFLSNYYMVIFLVFLLFIIKFFYGFEKDRHRYIKDVIITLFIYIFTFLILYYLFGLIVSFAKSGYYTLELFINFTLRTFLIIVFRELLRYQVLNKCDGNSRVTILSIITFVMLDLTNVIYFYSFNDNYSIFIFIALYLLPFISNNLLATYLSKKVGYKPVIFFMLIINLYPFLLPIIPNPNRYLASIINFCFPLVVLYKQYMFFKKEDDEHIVRDYNKKNISWLFVSFTITVVLVYFTSGYFRYHAIAVASGSMYPIINKGDVVIIDKDIKYDSFNKGDVIAFNYSNVIIVHRIVNIVYDRGKYFFYTKGDANKNNDNYVIKQDMIEGKVKVKVPLVGYPTVWLNEM